MKRQVLSLSREGVKRVVFMSDLHCGHRVGLTPTEWQKPKSNKWHSIQVAMWDWYTNLMKRLAPIDIVIVNGDAIDGKGPKSEGTELIVTDRAEQATMAFQAIAYAKAGKYAMVRGTPYHVGPGEDYEDWIADRLECKVGDHEWYDINGLIIDCKHAISGSTQPHTKATGILSDNIWNIIWAEHDKLQPMSDVYVRSHLHSYMDVSGIRRGQRCFILPALQGFGSKYGAKQCRRMVDVGVLVCDIKDRNHWSWTVELMDMRLLAATAVKL
jgi:hypothetical protein